MAEKGKNFTKISIAVEAIALCNLILYALTEVTKQRVSGLAVYCLALIVDILILTVLTKRKMQKTAIAMRYLVVLMLSFYIVFFYNKSILAITVLLLFCQIVELIFMIDFTDLYSRLIVMSVSVFPIALLTIVEQLFFSSLGNSYAIELISVVAALIVVVNLMSKLFIEWISNCEKRILEQKRKNENANEANENLLLFQDKLRKVNEELGIQKIRVESANRQVNKSNAEMKVQNEVLKYISSAIEQKELVQKATEALCNAMDMKFCCVVMRDVADEKTFIYHETHKEISDSFMDYLKDCVLGERLSELCSLKKIYTDKAMHRLYTKALMQQDELAVIMAVPIISDAENEGVIICGHEKQDFFDESATVFENLAAQLVMALKNAKLYAKVQQLAIRDGLTGLYNRRYLNQLVSEYSIKATEENQSLTAVLMDIDNFKGFNDTYGHAFGDIVLTKLAELLGQCAGKNEGISARYGGEEFVAVFPNKDMNTVYEVIADLQETINNTSLDYSGTPVSIHVSIGISSYPETAPTPETILNRADAAMYYAKRNGKNQITKDSDEVLAYFRKRSKETD